MIIFAGDIDSAEEAPSTWLGNPADLYNYSQDLPRPPRQTFMNGAKAETRL